MDKPPSITGNINVRGDQTVQVSYDGSDQSNAPQERGQANWRIRFDIMRQHLCEALVKCKSDESQSYTTELEVLTRQFAIEVKDNLERFLPEEVSANTELQLEAMVLASKKGTTSHTNRIKLPKLEPPKFAGDILKYHEFWDRFQASIDSQSLSGAEKLSYLQACLSHEALATIEGLECTNQNYQVALDILKTRFGKSDMIINAHYEALTQLPRASSNSKSCMDTFNEIERHLRVLQAKGEDTNHNHIRATIIGKFPEELIYEVKSQLKPGDETVEKIRKSLERLLMNRGMKNEPYTTEALHSRATEVRSHAVVTQKDCPAPAAGRPASNSNKGIKRRYPCTQTRKDTKKRKILPCVFCKGTHYNSDCPKPIKERRSLLAGRCFRCFKTDHRAAACKWNRPCHFCHGDHNRALCDKKESKRGNQQETKVQLSCSGGLTLLPTAIINIGNIRCRAMLDSGSQRSYVSLRIAKDLSEEVGEQVFLTVYTFGSNIPQNVASSLREIEVIGEETTIPMKVYVMPFIAERVEPPKTELQRLVTRRGLRVADDGSLGSRVDILIGNDYYNVFVKPERISFGEQLFLINSELGWIWSGKVEEDRKETLTMISHVQRFAGSNLDLPLKNSFIPQLWDLETIGIADLAKSNRDDQAVTEFNKTVQFSGGRYWIQWPWREEVKGLSDNFNLAFGRLKGLLKRSSQDLIQKYDSILREQMIQGITEQVEEIETDTRIHYLPHHAVKKGDTIRIVYDASSKVKDSNSLNECLYTGPSLLEDLVGLIIKFRIHKYGVLADIEKAFLQIGVQVQDRDVTRFLWLREINKEPVKDNLIHLRFCRVPFGIVCSPFILAITLKHHLQQQNTPIGDKVARDIYVDNLVTGGDTEEDCVNLYTETVRMLKEISMNMREWYTNSSELQNIIETDKLGTKGERVPILGMTWLVKEDYLTVKKPKTATFSSLTKRQVLSVISSKYDPCGYATPLFIAAKHFLQKLWISKVDWDTPLSPELQEEWATLVEDLEDFENVQVPRWLGIHSPLCETQLEIHCFTDASSVAYATAIYLRVSEGSVIRVNLIMSKTRLKPIKEKSNNTIPRLELLGLVIGCRLVNYVKRQLDLPIKCTYLWCDSQIVLHWLNTKRVLPPFVAARLIEVQRAKDVIFRYVPSNLNPADLATRPCKKLSDQKHWLAGPSFLREPPLEWPSSEGDRVMLCLGDTEELEGVIKIQQENFPNEYLGKTTNLARALGIFKDDDGVLRCRGRFKFVDLPVDQKFPILIPKNCDFTTNKIVEIHNRLHHVGVSQTLANIRLKYWFPHGRSQVQRVLKRCQVCVKHGGGPYKLPGVAPLPKERLTYSSPFTYTGTDYLGPLYVVGASGHVEKRWICLYTCFAVRAIHLETVSDLSAEECLLAFRRFVATRGIPSVILSDNASNYKLTADVLTGEFCIQNKIMWKFIPELAPWFGGLYERLVALVKHCLKRTIDKHTLNGSQLNTIVKEIEATLNTRPLTTVGADLDHVLTPADFLRVGGSLTMDKSEKAWLDPNSDTKKNLIEGWKKGQLVLEEYKKMFVERYLPLLRERYSVVKQPRVKYHLPPKIGDVVQIKEEGPRVKWKVGQICKLLESNDNEVRVAIVKVGDKEYRRAINHLFPLEIEGRDEVEENKDNGGKEPELSEKKDELDNEKDKVNEEPNKEREKYDEEIVNKEKEIGVQSLEQSGEIVDLKDETQPSQISDKDSSEGEAQNSKKETGGLGREAEGSEDVEIPEAEARITEEESELPEDLKKKRRAAEAARKKIREWTRELFD